MATGEVALPDTEEGVNCSNKLQDLEAAGRRKLRKDVVQLPQEATSWTQCEVDIWFWTSGRVHPRDMKQAMRNRTSGDNGRPNEAPAARTNESDLLSRENAEKVSVLTPTMESRHEFHKLLWACFVHQTWPNKELVVFETFRNKPSEFFVEMQRKDDRLVYVGLQITDHDLTIGAKRNLCQYLASGTIAANFDDDDIYAPAYLATMIKKMQRDRAIMITLSTWYMFDVKLGQFGFCDPPSWASDEGIPITNDTVNGWIWGYGFSYVYSLAASRDRNISYPNSSVLEDFRFVKWMKQLHGEGNLTLFMDTSGICLHMLHGSNTTHSFCRFEVHRDEILELEIAELDETLDYIKKFPRRDASSAFIEAGARKKRPCRDLTIHWHLGDFTLRCYLIVRISRIRELCAEKVCLEANLLELHLAPPPKPLRPLGEFEMLAEVDDRGQEDVLRNPLDDVKRIDGLVTELWLSTGAANERSHHLPATNSV